MGRTRQAIWLSRVVPATAEGALAGSQRSFFSSDDQKAAEVVMPPVDANPHVTTTMLYRAIDDTKEVLRAEHAATRLEIASINLKLESICKKLNARPAAHWLGGRGTAMLDRMLPLSIVALVTWLLTHAA